MNWTLLAVGIMAFGGLAATEAAARDVRGCNKAGVAGPWIGRGVARLSVAPWFVNVSFTDDFKVTAEELTGHMRFQRAGFLQLPKVVSDALSERYTVTFGEGDDIGFSSNWGRGGGVWSRTEFNMSAMSHAGGASVKERGTVVDCDHLLIEVDVFELGAQVMSLSADYTRE